MFREVEAAQVPARFTELFTFGTKYNLKNIEVNIKSGASKLEFRRPRQTVRCKPTILTLKFHLDESSVSQITIIKKYFALNQFSMNFTI